MNTPSIKQPNLNTNNYYIKIKPYIPYIIGIISLLIISIIIYILIDDKPTKKEGSTGTGTDTATGSTRRRRSNFVGNKSLDKIYDDADGNKVLSNAQLTSTINL